MSASYRNFIYKKSAHFFIFTMKTLHAYLFILIGHGFSMIHWPGKKCIIITSPPEFFSKLILESGV